MTCIQDHITRVESLTSYKFGGSQEQYSHTLSIAPFLTLFW